MGRIVSFSVDPGGGEIDFLISFRLEISRRVPISNPNPSPAVFYPAFLNLTDKECLVVGGGVVALQKVRALRAAGARVTVVATRFRPAFRRLSGLRRVQRAFRPADLTPATGRPWLVVASTDDEALHARIAAVCRRKKIWVNVVDRPLLCDFIVPAVVRRGPVTLAVSTGGRSPALAKFIGAKLRATVGGEYGRLATVLSQLRPLLRQTPMAERTRFLERFLSDRTLAALRRGGRSAERRLKNDIVCALGAKGSS